MKMRRAPARRFCLLLAGLVFTGCAQIATVKFVAPSLVATTNPDSGDELRQAARLQRTYPLQALGDDLASSRAAMEQLQRNPNDKSARQRYNFSVARAIEVIEQAHLDPWDRALSVPMPNGVLNLTSVRHQGPDRDPAAYEIIPADSLIISGIFFNRRVTVDGIGAPLVAIGRQEKKDYRQTFAVRRLYRNVTAVVRFDDHRAQIEFFDPFATEQVSLGRHRYRLAADFTAASAVGLTREHPEKLGLTRMIHPDKYTDTARLVRLQTYDPNRIPVIFVHGLQDTPTSWVPMINALYEDPVIRRRYQFWVFSYPSGYPYPYAAELFRKELDGVAKTYPDHKPVVLIGHSMGGIISRLMITDARDKIWRSYFGKPPEETKLPGPTRRFLEQSLIFNHRPEVARVIFICAPHRGAPMGANWIGYIGTKLVHMPLLVASLPLRVVESAVVPDAATAHLNRIPTSIDTLSPNNRFVKEVNKIPITPGIPFHTIEGDRGRGDAPNSSDGVVPYWSSHLEGAQSELIVPSNHSAPRNPQAIAEVKRILHLHLGIESSEF